MHLVLVSLYARVPLQIRIFVNSKGCSVKTIRESLFLCHRGMLLEKYIYKELFFLGEVGNSEVFCSCKIRECFVANF